jgi:hypoxia up-regulated 1
MTVETLMKDNEKWMDPLMEVQVRLDKEGDHTQDPVILTKDLNEKGKLLQSTVSFVVPFKLRPSKLMSQVLRLINKKAPRAPKAIKPSSSATSSSETSAGSEKEKETEPVTPPVHEEL